MNARNYQRELEALIAENEASGTVPRLLLHVCCAPCSSWCLEYLAPHFEVTVYYYNPNIDSAEEYRRRAEEEERLLREMKLPRPVGFLKGPYEPERFAEMARGHEKDAEGGVRCFLCYEQRLRKTAEVAKEGHYDCFTTTLTISPMKRADVLNRIGEQVAKEYQIPFLPSDFKKKDGYRRSTELSKQYSLYRQDYCGCRYSKAETMRKRAEKRELEQKKPEQREPGERESGTKRAGTKRAGSKEAGTVSCSQLKRNGASAGFC